MMVVTEDEVLRGSKGAFSDQSAKLRMSYIYNTTQAEDIN